MMDNKHTKYRWTLISLSSLSHVGMDQDDITYLRGARVAESNHQPKYVNAEQNDGERDVNFDLIIILSSSGELTTVRFQRCRST
jgi:hypothetical protein